MGAWETATCSLYNGLIDGAFVFVGQANSLEVRSVLAPGPGSYSCTGTALDLHARSSRVDLRLFPARPHKPSCHEGTHPRSSRERASWDIPSRPSQFQGALLPRGNGPHGGQTPCRFCISSTGPSTATRSALVPQTPFPGLGAGTARSTASKRGSALRRFSSAYLGYGVLPSHPET